MILAVGGIDHPSYSFMSEFPWAQISPEFIDFDALGEESLVARVELLWILQKEGNR